MVLKMNKKNYIELKLISIALLISSLISDYLFCSVLGNWIELCIIFFLFLLSIFITKCCSLFSYLNMLVTQFLTIILYIFSSIVLKNSFFKEDLISLFIFSVFLCIISLVIKQKNNYVDSRFIFVDFLIIFMGIGFYVILSLYTNIKGFKFYHLFSILFIQSFFVYPVIFIMKKISLKFFKNEEFEW